MVYKKLNRIFIFSFSVIKFFTVKAINNIKNIINIISKISPKEKLNLPESLLKFPARLLYKNLE